MGRLSITIGVLLAAALASADGDRRRTFNLAAEASGLFDRFGIDGEKAIAAVDIIAEKVAQLGSLIEPCLEAVIVQRYFLAEPLQNDETAARAYTLAQLSTLAYSKHSQPPLAPSSTPLSLSMLDGTGVEACTALEVVLCTTLQHPAPGTGLPLRTPSFCLLRTPDALVLTIRGTANPDDVVVDVYGVSWLEDVPAFPNGTAAVHGGFWRAWAYSGAAEIVEGLLRDETTLEASGPTKPLYITGHSLGGAIASVAAHDLTLAMLNGSLPSRPIELYTFGKPPVGGDAYRASFSTLLALGSGGGSAFRRAERYVTATDWGVDPIAGLGVDVPGMVRCLRSSPEAPRQRMCRHGYGATSPPATAYRAARLASRAQEKQSRSVRMYPLPHVELLPECDAQARAAKIGRRHR